MTHFHLSGAMLGPGSIILPGNWGRVVASYGWRHSEAVKEMALEHARLTRFPHRPSRLECAFVLLTMDDVNTFRQIAPAFAGHVLYRVCIADPNAGSHITDTRLCAPQGTFRPDWADVYWMDFEAQAAAIPGIDWPAATRGLQSREMLTLSHLIVEERLN